MKKILISIFFVLICAFSVVSVDAQVSNLNFCIRYNVSTSTPSGNNYTITGTVSDFNGVWDASFVNTGDTIYYLDENILFALSITSISVQSGNSLTCVAASIAPFVSTSSVGNLNGQLVISRKTAKGYCPVPAGSNEYLKSAMENRFKQQSTANISNIDNTSDANKPTSGATATALNLKVNLSDTSALADGIRNSIGSSTTTTSNGLTKTGNNITLGGTLTGATTITTGANLLNIEGKMGIKNTSPNAYLDILASNGTNISAQKWHGDVRNPSFPQYGRYLTEITAANVGFMTNGFITCNGAIKTGDSIEIKVGGNPYYMVGIEADGTYPCIRMKAGGDTMLVGHKNTVNNEITSVLYNDGRLELGIDNDAYLAIGKNIASINKTSIKNGGIENIFGGEAFNRFRLASDGLNFGSGTSALDALLYRESALKLRTNSDVVIDRTLSVTTNGTVLGKLGVGIQALNKMDVNGGLVIGSVYAGLKTAPTDGLLVKGKVAVGRVIPLATLHIDGNPSGEAFTSFAMSDTSVATDEKNWVWQTGAAIGSGIMRLRNLNDAATNGSNALIFRRSGITPVNIEVPSGNFGIGITPTVALDVVGQIRNIGLVAGATTDSIVTSASGVLKRLSVDSIMFYGRRNGINLTTTTSSLRVPRLTTTQRDALNGAAGSVTGDVIYNSTLDKYQLGNASATWVSPMLENTTVSTAYNTLIAANTEATLTFAITGITTTSAVNVTYTGTLPVSIVVKPAEVTAGQVIVRLSNLNTVTGATPNVTVNVTPIKF